MTHREVLENCRCLVEHELHHRPDEGRQSGERLLASIHEAIGDLDNRVLLEVNKVSPKRGDLVIIKVEPGEFYWQIPELLCKSGVLEYWPGVFFMVCTPDWNVTDLDELWMENNGWVRSEKAKAALADEPALVKLP